MWVVIVDYLYCNKANTIYRLSVSVKTQNSSSFQCVAVCGHTTINFLSPKLCVAYNDLYRKILHVSQRSSASEIFVKNNITNLKHYFGKKFICLLLD